MVVKYSSSSPYYRTPQNSWSLDLYTHREIPEKSNDVLLTLDQIYDKKPHLLAYDLYGDTRLWWVFAVRNPDVIKDPVFDFVAGIQIYVTDKAVLKSLLNV